MWTKIYEYGFQSIIRTGINVVTIYGFKSIKMDSNPQVAVTQPRRVAAVSLAKRVAR